MIADTYKVIPATLNRYPVIRVEKCEDRYVVMVKRPMQQGTVHPYVVATWLPHLGNEWHHGAYLRTRKEADVVFEEVCERYGRL